MKKSLKLFPFDDNFSLFFNSEKARLSRALDPVVIEHIGSTAVPGLGGKGIIDIAIGVPESFVLQTVANKLINLGYFYNLDDKMPKDRIFLASREHDSTLGDYHLHVVVKDGDEWNNLLFFRNCLINNIRLRNEYMTLKERLFNETGADREKYKELKNNFIQRVLKYKV